MPERIDYGYAASNAVATIVIINSESPGGEISGKIHNFALFED